MQRLPSNSFDMSFADPPFNIGKKYGRYDDTEKSKEEYLEWSYSWLKEIVRITKPTGSIFIHNLPRWLTCYANFLDELAVFSNWIVWDEHTGAKKQNALIPTHYGILYYTKTKGYRYNKIRTPHQLCRSCQKLLKNYGGKMKYAHSFGPALSDVWHDIKRLRHTNKRDKHPCQLPPALLERLILMSTNPGDLVFDPFMGTGTTAVAAKKLGRCYAGIELDPAYIEIAQAHLAPSEETKIDECFVSFHLGAIKTIQEEDWRILEKRYERVLQLMTLPKSA